MIAFGAYTEMPARLSEVEAIRIMLDAGVEPVVAYPGSDTPWRCRCQRCERIVQPRLGNVRKGHGACKYCTGRVVLPSEARARMRAAGFSPLVAYPGAGKPWRSRCLACKTVSSPRYANVMSGQGCRTCANERSAQRRRIPEEKARAFMLRAGLGPLVPYPGANKPWRCRCTKCGRQVSPTYTDVAAGHRCRFCSAAEAGRRSRLDAQKAAKVMLGANLEPLVPYTKSDEKWPCRCTVCGSEVSPTYSNIKAGWGGCPTCARTSRAQKRRRGEDDAVAIMRAAGVEPLEPYVSEMVKWRAQCRTCGREVAPRLNSVKRNHRACAYCSRNKADPKEAAAVMRRAGLRPLVPYPGRHAPWLSECKRCHQTVTPRYGAVVRGGGCRYCNDTAIAPDAAAALMRDADLDPLEPYPGSNTLWKCRCTKCRRTVMPRYSTIQRGSGGCWYCRESGFKVGAPAVVYLVTHQRLNAAKVGIANQTAVRHRIGQHTRNGWELLASYDSTGRKALDTEQAVLDWWRGDLGLAVAVKARDMQQGGYTETVDLSAIDLAATMQMIETRVLDAGRREPVPMAGRLRSQQTQRRTTR